MSSQVRRSRGEKINNHLTTGAPPAAAAAAAGGGEDHVGGVDTLHAGWVCLRLYPHHQCDLHQVSPQAETYLPSSVCLLLSVEVSYPHHLHPSQTTNVCCLVKCSVCAASYSSPGPAALLTPLLDLCSLLLFATDISS